MNSWFKTTHIYSLRLLETKSQKLVSLGQHLAVGRASVPKEPLSGGVTYFSFRKSLPLVFWLWTFFGLWLHPLSPKASICHFLCILSSYSLLLCTHQTSLCLFLARTLLIAVMAHPDNQGWSSRSRVLNLITFKWSYYCHVRWHSRVWGIRTQMSLGPFIFQPSIIVLFLHFTLFGSTFHLARCDN